jgi:hypothetical protein
MNSIAQIMEAMQTVLTQEADRLGRETGFIQRQVKWSGRTFVQTLVLGFLSNPEASYSELSQSAATLGLGISNQGLEQRFTETAAVFVRQVLEAMVKQVVLTNCNPFPVLDSFNGVYIRDSSVIALPNELQEIWHGVGGTAGETAALKLQVNLDFQTGRVHGPVLQEGRAHDQTSPFQTESLPAGALHLGDLGYFNLDRLAKDQAEGVFWITRLKLGTSVYGLDGQRLELASWLSSSAASLIDIQVSLGEKHRLSCRFIAVRVPQEVADRRRHLLKESARKKQRPVSAQQLKLAEWTVVVTNVPEERLSAHDVLTLLRVRWQVELLFKLWKSHAKVDEWRSENPWRILCEIYAKLIGLCLSHWLFAVSLWPYPDRSLFQAAKTVQKWATPLALAMQDPGQLRTTLIALCNCLMAGCRQQKRKTHAATFQELLSLR